MKIIRLYLNTVVFSQSGTKKSFDIADNWKIEHCRELNGFTVQPINGGKITWIPEHAVNDALVEFPEEKPKAVTKSTGKV